MQYDAVGNVTKIVDGVNSETVDYTYDDLDRLLTASVPTGESFAYDTIGNMTTKSGATLDYGTTAPKHAVKSHGSTTYTYDANGSMSSRGTQTIKYDPEQRPIRVQDGNSIHRSAYDGDGVRRKREDSNGTVHYLGGYERKLAGGSNSPETITKYYSASLGALSRPVAFRRGGTLHWVGSDHLGGTVRVLDSSFTALDGMRYKPYGEDRDAGTALVTDRKFTGQTEDEAAGLYWYASRAYDPEIGRFVSPDPIVPDPSKPQSLNRYGYVRNNPLKFVDPSGHSEEWVNKAWRDEFFERHKREPNGMDIAYRYASMDATSRGDDWSVEYWAGVVEQAASSIAVWVRNAFVTAPVLESQAVAWATARAISPSHGFDESEQDAVRHAYWSGILTIQYGAKYAEHVTDRHERYGDEHGQKTIDRVMDLYNNEVGRDIAAELPWYHGDYRYIQLMERILQAESEGLLMKIEDGQLVPTSPVNYSLPLLVQAMPQLVHQR